MLFFGEDLDGWWVVGGLSEVVDVWMDGVLWSSRGSVDCLCTGWRVRGMGRGLGSCSDVRFLYFLFPERTTKYRLGSDRMILVVGVYIPRLHLTLIIFFLGVVGGRDVDKPPNTP